MKPISITALHKCLFMAKDGSSARLPASTIRYPLTFDSARATILLEETILNLGNRVPSQAPPERRSKANTEVTWGFGHAETTIASAPTCSPI
jgi:hypothetical protein